MKKRLVLTMLVTVVLLLLIVPAAQAISLTSITPSSAYPGQTVACSIAGTLNAGWMEPHFELRVPGTAAGAIVGSSPSVGWDATGAAGVSFAIPATWAGTYDLYCIQSNGVTFEEAFKYGAFTVVDTTPVVSGISPSQFVIWSPPGSFTITGSNFVAPSFSGGIFWPGSVVQWGIDAVTPTSVTPTTIVVSPPPEVVNQPGIVGVKVHNPSGLFPDGPWSDAFPVSCLLPAPHITEPNVQPASLPAGSPTTPIDVYGDNFYATGVAASTVVWDAATDLPTTWVSSTHLRATVSAGMLGSAGIHGVSVRNGNDARWQVSSISVRFDVTAPTTPTPVVSSLSPWATTVGVTPGTLDVIGSGFVSGAVVVWTPAGGASTDLATAFGSGTLLHATLPLALVNAAGGVSVTVRNGPPGSPTSAPVTFAVMMPSPGVTMITGLAPNTAVAGGPAFDLKVTGTNFITGPSGAVVVWNGTDLATTRTSTTELHAQVPADLVATAGTASVTVRNGLGGGAPVSNAVTFTVTSSGGGGGTFALASLEPSQVYVGYVGPGITLTVNGSGFVSGAHIWLGTQEKTNTTFVSATKLTTTLLPAELASAGTIQVSVKNPPAVASPSTLPLGVSNETTDPTVTIQGADPGWHNSPVTLTFVGSDPQSGVQKVQYRCPPAVGSWTTGTSYTVPTTTQGEISVSAQVFDWCDRVGSASATVRIDTTKPQTDALNAVSVKRGRIARLRFRVSEPSGLSPAAAVTLQIRKGKRVVWTKVLSGVPMNSTEQYSFKVRLKKGSYRWYVLATDLAGNRQAKADRSSFKVT